MRRKRFFNVANIGFAAARQGMYLLGAVYYAYGILSGSATWGTLSAVMQLVRRHGARMRFMYIFRIRPLPWAMERQLQL